MSLPNEIYIKILEERGLVIKAEIRDIEGVKLDLTETEKKIFLAKAKRMYIDGTYYEIVRESEIRDKKGKLVEFIYRRLSE